MPALITTIAQLQAVTGGAVNASVDMDALAPYLDIAQERHLEDWLGSDLYEDLQGNSLSPALTTLLPYYRKALGWLALYEYLPFSAVQLSDSGLHRIENDQRKTAYKYQERRVLDTCLTNGFEAFERLILFLDANRTDYPQWAAATGYSRHHSVLLHTAAIFRAVDGKKMTRHVFEMIRSTVEDVEAMALIPLFGQAQYDALLDHRRTGTWTTEAKEKKAILLAQRISAHFALSEALKRNWVQLEGDRVTQREYLEDQGVPKEGAPTLQALGTRINLHDDTANRYIKKLRDYLAAELEDDAFADYAEWQTTLAELAEAEAEAAALAACETTCCDTTPRHDGGNAFGFGEGCSTTRKGVVRL